MAGQAANLRAGRGDFRMEPLGVSAGDLGIAGWSRVVVLESMCVELCTGMLSRPISCRGLSSGLVANTRGPAAGQSKGARIDC